MYPKLVPELSPELHRINESYVAVRLSLKGHHTAVTQVELGLGVDGIGLCARAHGNMTKCLEGVHARLNERRFWAKKAKIKYELSFRNELSRTHLLTPLGGTRGGAFLAPN